MAPSFTKPPTAICAHVPKSLDDAIAAAGVCRGSHPRRRARRAHHTSRCLGAVRVRRGSGASRAPCGVARALRAALPTNAGADPRADIITGPGAKACSHTRHVTTAAFPDKSYKKTSTVRPTSVGAAGPHCSARRQLCTHGRGPYGAARRSDTAPGSAAANRGARWQAPPRNGSVPGGASRGTAGRARRLAPRKVSPQRPQPSHLGRRRRRERDGREGSERDPRHLRMLMPAPCLADFRSPQTVGLGRSHAAARRGQHVVAARRGGRVPRGAARGSIRRMALPVRQQRSGGEPRRGAGRRARAAQDEEGGARKQGTRARLAGQCACAAPLAPPPPRPAL